MPMAEYFIAHNSIGNCISRLQWNDCSLQQHLRY